MVTQHESVVQTVDSLASSLLRLQDVLARPDFQAAARQHARGKLTVQEKIACLFDAGTFVEDLVPRPDLDPRHGERRLLTGHGQMHGRPVAAAIFDSVVGRENVIAGTDCGFGTSADRDRVAPSISWAKLKAMAEGAQLASQQLWS
jgi:acetyl-CoA carboxylase carboxyltransferase component